MENFVFKRDPYKKKFVLFNPKPLINDIFIQRLFINILLSFFGDISIFFLYKME
jgi:hypothetical protein